MPKKKPITMQSCHYAHTEAIDVNAKDGGGDAWEGLINVCVSAAQDALETPPTGYTAIQRNSLFDIFGSMKVTQRAIRLLVRLGDTAPESVDALVLARLQLEGLYTVCLLIESPNNVDRFVHEAWKRQYIRWMLNQRETETLPQFAADNDKDYERLMFMKGVWKVSDRQQETITYYEQGIPNPPGFTPEVIGQFPTPRKVIDELPEGTTKRRMLERLYLEYQDLCAYAHGRPVAGFDKSIFDERSRIREEFIALHGEEHLRKHFQHSVVAPTQIYSFVSVAQAAAELTTLYPHNVELLAAVIKAWNALHGCHMLVNAIWNIHTRAMLGLLPPSQSSGSAGGQAPSPPAPK